VQARNGRATDGGWIGITALSLAAVALISFIVGLTSFYWGGLLLAAIGASIAAIVLGAIGLKKKNGGAALAGMILGILEIVAFLTLIVVLVAAFA
jgi:hypothetical protein